MCVWVAAAAQRDNIYTAKQNLDPLNLTLLLSLSLLLTFQFPTKDLKSEGRKTGNNRNVE